MRDVVILLVMLADAAAEPYTVIDYRPNTETYSTERYLQAFAPCTHHNCSFVKGAKALSHASLLQVQEAVGWSTTQYQVFRKYLMTLDSSKAMVGKLLFLDDLVGGFRPLGVMIAELKALVFNMAQFSAYSEMKELGARQCSLFDNSFITPESWDLFYQGLASLLDNGEMSPNTAGKYELFQATSQKVDDIGSSWAKFELQLSSETIPDASGRPMISTVRKCVSVISGFLYACPTPGTVICDEYVPVSHGSADIPTRRRVCVKSTAWPIPPSASSEVTGTDYLAQIFKLFIHMLTVVELMDAGSICI